MSHSWDGKGDGVGSGGGAAVIRRRTQRRRKGMADRGTLGAWEARKSGEKGKGQRERREGKGQREGRKGKDSGSGERGKDSGRSFATTRAAGCRGVMTAAAGCRGVVAGASQWASCTMRIACGGGTEPLPQAMSRECNTRHKHNGHYDLLHRHGYCDARCGAITHGWHVCAPDGRGAPCAYAWTLVSPPHTRRP